MILLVAASERGLLAKLHACDTWQGLRVWCCGVYVCAVCQLCADVVVVSGKCVESPAVDGESPVRESHGLLVAFVPE